MCADELEERCIRKIDVKPRGSTRRDETRLVLHYVLAYPPQPGSRLVRVPRDFPGAFIIPTLLDEYYCLGHVVFKPIKRPPVMHLKMAY